MSAVKMGGPAQKRKTWKPAAEKKEWESQEKSGKEIK